MKRFFVYALAAFALSSSVMSCDKEETLPEPSVLETPKLALADTAATSVTVIWDAVENAASYEVMLNNDEASLIPVTGTEYELETPEEGTYTVKVRALPAEGENYLASEWSEALEYKFVKPEEPDPDPEPEEPVMLETPEPGIGESTETYFVVEWEAVANAASYEYTVNDGGAQSITGTSVQIETPEAGTYTVRVRALPAEDSEEYLASDWSEPVTYELEDLGDGKTKLAAPEVIFQYFSQDVLCRWNKIENAASYEYIVDDGAATVITKNTVTLPKSDYKPGDHTVQVRALPEDGSEEFEASDWGSAVFTIEGEEEEPAGIEDWFGTYTVTSSYGLAFVDNGGSLGMNTVQESVTFTVTISEYDAGNGAEDSLALFTGWSAWYEGAPGLAQLMPDGSLALLSDVQIDESEGISIQWVVVGDNEGEIAFITGCPYSFLMTDNGGSVSVEPYSGYLSDNTEFTAIGTDLFGISTGISVFNVPWTMPAGEFTIEKTSDSYMAPLPVYTPMRQLSTVLRKDTVSAEAIPMAR